MGNAKNVTCHTPLVITGFMGAGKTAVGRLVAQRLGREFVDTDALIQAREGQSVRAIFEARGEEYFRELERQVCRELATRANVVIATGGGTLVDARNRAAFERAFVVCLDATAEALLARLNGALARPLLTSGAPRQRIDDLLGARAPAYAQIEQHVDTTALTVEQVAEKIIGLWLTKYLAARAWLEVTSPEGAYPVVVGQGLLTRVAEIVNSLGDSFSPRCAVVTNPRVGGWYAERVVASLRASGFEPQVSEIPDGENFKRLDTVSAIYDQLLDAQLDRHSILFALGGGVVGDITGLAAATFLRGVPFVQLPTTLLAMVDASIGGKVGVDHPRGKNLIGAFKQPRAVIADVDALGTLPLVEWRAGMAEVVKHAVIGDAGLFESLETGDWKPVLSGVEGLHVGDWIARAMQVKVAIVSRDPFERGERAKLNLGHTFAHAFEKLSHYEMRHGEAVAIGLVGAARLAARRQMCEASLAERLERLLRAIELPTRTPRQFSADQILCAMTTDKKRVKARLRFVLPRALGDVVMVDDVAPEEIVAVVEETRA